MSNAISRAARKRMAETGEPYTVARRAVIEERERLKGVTVTVDGRSVAGEILELQDGAGELLHAMLGGREPEPGPPYNHVLQPPPYPEEGEPHEPPPPSLTITRDGAALCDEFADVPTVPVVTAPEMWTPEQVEVFKAEWDRLTGDPHGLRHQIRLLPPGPTVVEHEDGAELPEDSCARLDGEVT